MPEADQTADGGYEHISYHTFNAVSYERYMAWKAGAGWIAVGATEVTSRRKTDADDEDVLAPGQSVVVRNTNFKLVRKT